MPQASTLEPPDAPRRIFFGRPLPPDKYVKVMGFALLTLAAVLIPGSFLAANAVRGFGLLLVGAIAAYQGATNRTFMNAIRRVPPEVRAEGEQLVAKVAAERRMPVPVVTVIDQNYVWPKGRVFRTTRFGNKSHAYFWLPEVHISHRFKIPLPALKLEKKPLMNAAAAQLLPNVRHPERLRWHVERRPSWYLRSVEMPSLPRVTRISGQRAHHMVLTTEFLRIKSQEQKEAVIHHEAAHLQNNHSFRRITRLPLQLATSKYRLYLLYAAAFHAAGLPLVLLAGATVANIAVRQIRMAQQRRWEYEADQGAIDFGHGKALEKFFRDARPKQLAAPDAIDKFRDTFIPPFNSHPPIRDRVANIERQLLSRPEIGLPAVKVTDGANSQRRASSLSDGRDIG